VCLFWFWLSQWMRKTTGTANLCTFSSLGAPWDLLTVRISGFSCRFQHACHASAVGGDPKGAPNGSLLLLFHLPTSSFAILFPAGTTPTRQTPLQTTRRGGRQGRPAATGSAGAQE